MVAEIRKVSPDDPILSGYAIEPTSFNIWVGLWDGELALIWGLTPTSLISDKAYIWSISTPVVRRCPKSLLKLSRAWLRETEFVEYIGLCDCKTTWVKHLGAQFESTNTEYALFTIRI